VGLALNTIHQGDSVKKLGKITPGSIDLVFADPPFNIGYDYDVYDDRRGEDDYLDWSRQWITGVHGALKPNGTFWLAIGDEYAAELKVITKEIGFTCRSWVIWYYTFGVNCRRGFSRSHTHLFHFVKDPRDFTFNEANPAVRVPSARQLVYADARANPKGRLPDNTWILRPQDLPRGFPTEHDTWYFPRVAGTFKEREGFHGCQMPEQLLGRIIRICSNATDIVLDPFAGSGTTLAVAKKLGRRWIGIELSKEYAARVRQRLKDASVGAALDGTEMPHQSAPATKKGKTRGVLRAGHRGGKTQSTKAQQIREEIEAGVRQAYRLTHDGFSTDAFLAQPELNRDFLVECKKQGVPGEPVIWNQTLLRLRKQKKLPRMTERRHRVTLRDMDCYSFASEIALMQVSASCDLSLDELLCDPELAAHFDAIAERFAPGYSPFEYRWAALALRKRAMRSKRAADQCQEWLKNPLPDAVPLDSCKPQEDDQPGVYALIGRDDIRLYVGETYQLARRIQQTKETPAWKELDPQFVRLCPETETRLLGLKSVLIQRVKPMLNSPLLAAR
jgi:site-specific DNA-methyltransferase (adenine-specific)